MTKMIPEPRNISYENHLIGIEILNVYEDIEEYCLSKLKKAAKPGGTVWH